METIPLSSLAIMAIPALAVIAIQQVWLGSAKTGGLANLRMAIQLIAIGFVLDWIFAGNSVWITAAVLMFMMVMATWIALGPLSHQRLPHMPIALIAMIAGGLTTLLLVIELIVGLAEWNSPRIVIPLAGMVFANSMNSMSIAIERQQSEINNGKSDIEANKAAFAACVLPLNNSMLAVGLVSLPGMMTGQILSGVDPLIAVRYQILVMLMIYGASGISAAVMLRLMPRG